MKRFWSALLGVLLVFSLIPSTAFAETPNEEHASTIEGSYTEHEAIVCVVEDASNGEIAPLSNTLLDGATPLMELSNETLKEISESDSALKVESEDAVMLLSAETTPTGQIYLVRDESKTTAQIIEELEQDERVLYAEPNWLIEKYDTEEEALAVGNEESKVGETEESKNESGEEKTVINEVLPQNEEAEETPVTEGTEATLSPQALNKLFDGTPYQWGMSNTGNLGGADKADINYAAWNSTTAAPSNDIVVAVIDSGVDYQNKDLINKMWGQGEDPQFLSLGGDKYGFASNPDPQDSFPSTADKSGHGTHCAGIIAAQWNSDYGWGGVSGVSRNAAIMAVQYGGSMESIVRCFDYICKAKDAGANVKVASCSWGLGTTQARTLDALVRQAGEKDILSVFASGNDHYNNDLAADATATLKDNPYAIVVNSIDSTGKISGFSNYGKNTTDIMAPGSAILSTHPVNMQQYIAEQDVWAQIYESFDSASHGADEIVPSPGSPWLDFGSQNYETGKSTDGTTSLKLSYDSTTGPVMIQSVPIYVAGLPEKPKYISLRVGNATTFASDGRYHTADVMVEVRTQSGEYEMLQMEDGVMAYGDAWGFFYYKLPDASDPSLDPSEYYDQRFFSIRISAVLYSADLTGGIKDRTPVSGDILIDSIGVGNILAEGAYKSGTSMACPAVSGVAALFAETYSDSGEKLAARVKGAAVRDPQYDELCSTGGRVSVDTGANPAPSITEIKDDGENIKVSGYFFGSTISVDVEGISSQILGSQDLLDEKTELIVKKPVGLVGGETEVKVINQGNGQSGRKNANLANSSALTYYEQTDLPTFPALNDWDGWQLVGYNGFLFCLPTSSILTSQSFESVWRYDPNEKKWEEIALPLADFARAGLTSDVIAVTGATWQGKLVIQATDLEANSVHWLYDSKGTWEQMQTGVDVEEVPYRATLASDGDNLYLFGGRALDNGKLIENGIFKLNTDTKAFEKIGKLTSKRIHPQVSFRDGTFIVSAGQGYQVQGEGIGGVEQVTWNGDKLESTLLDFSPLVTETGQLAYASGATTTGFILAGPMNKSNDADTYLLDTGATAARGAATPTCFDKCADDNALLIPAATAYNGTFYVLAASAYEPYRVFSATTVSTVAQPGDYVLTPDPGPDPDPTPTPTPTPVPTPAEKGGATALSATGDNVAIIALAVGLLGSVALGTAVRAKRKRSRKSPF